MSCRRFRGPAVGRVASLRFVESFDVVEHVDPSLVARAVGLSGRALGFQRGEEAFHRGIVPDVAGPAHAAGHAMIRHELLERLTAVLAAAVGVMQQRIQLASASNRLTSASVTSCAAMVALIDQPTTRCENKSASGAT